MGAINITIYGADTDIKSMTPTLTEVQALNPVSQAFTLIALDSEPNLEIESNEYLGNFKRSVINVRWKSSAQLIESKYPSVVTNFNSYYYTELMKKPYKWIDLGNYKLTPTGVIGGTGKTLLAIEITGFSIDHNHEKGAKKVKLELESRGVI